MTDRLRLLSAFQVLQAPQGAYRGTTHEQARRVIGELTGHRPVGDFPATPAGRRLTLDDYMDWLALDACRHPSKGASL